MIAVKEQALTLTRVNNTAGVSTLCLTTRSQVWAVLSPFCRWEY